jgi:SAM-dependent methyltransferase
MDERLISEAPEQMDLEGTPAGVRAGILRDLDRVHGLIGSEQHLLALLEPFLARRVSGPLELLDIASGHGRFPIALARLARRRGLPLRITATDISVELLELCRQNVARSGESVQVRRLDALRPDLPPRSVDLVICTNSLHHFGTRGLLGLLAAAPALCREGMVLMDPFRAASALLPATLLFGLWGRERASVSDAQQSIRRAWTAEELRLLAGLVPPLRGAEIGYAAPGWWSLRWRAQGASVPAAG